MSTGLIDAKTVAAAPGDRPVITPALVKVMAALCLAALALAAFGRFTGIGVQQLPTAPAAEMRELLFLDAGKGAIEVRTAAGEALVKRFGPGEGGFVRTVMRGLAHDRMARGGDSRTPFTLTLRTDNRLIIHDPVTKREVILDSFGKPNRDLFAGLLASSGGTTTTAAGAAHIQGERK
jgi:putative photosynthetic complex assembly protein